MFNCLSMVLSFLNYVQKIHTNIGRITLKYNPHSLYCKYFGVFILKALIFIIIEIIDKGVKLT